MKYILLVLFVFLMSFRPLEASVYICGSTGAKKYHFNENCRGLSACSHGTVKTSIKQARGLGLTLCGWED
ncbi:hypothetical protein BC749_104112 [Flavobacterium araucananum]|uniref:Uncharacterized protein n=1 Tax=Flavobacterium araucananum TaxID=946678 RepID=A0A227NV31_9FLAO|nr:hypothetical protein [Flavobacterium araucananum]OXG01577.1 hypothetical protein B0A64_19125 [Flavobacterium araucananum]PWJ98966.1 hypothetical protein BC749_104112 [Flavobacterium araucananum]